MRGARNIRARRRPVFLGCEGESERAYCQTLFDIIESEIQTVHLEVVLLGEGAGSPLAKIQKAIKKIEGYERTRSKFFRRVVLMDSDLIEHNEVLRVRTENLATQHDIRIIWQSPCHEAFLLRHLPNCAQLRPPTTALANSVLTAQWPLYRKPMSRIEIANRIDSDRVRQVIVVENEFRLFLNDIGWQ
jgi:hypothetical protein